MYFYKVEGYAKVNDDSNEEMAEKMRGNGDYAASLQLKTINFNNELGEDSYLFVADRFFDHISIGIITQDCHFDNSILQKYLCTIDAGQDDENMSEVTFEDMKHMLSAAERNGFIRDDRKVYEKFNISEVKECSPLHSGFSYSDNMIQVSTKSRALTQAKKTLAADSLVEELNRIEMGTKITGAFGNPVHYIVSCDDESASETICSTLLSTLYRNKRISSRRYGMIKPITQIRVRQFSTSHYEAVYRLNNGGAVVVPISPADPTDSDNRDSVFETLGNICKTLKEYRNDVLTIILLPRECSKVKKYLYEQLNTVSIVEIREDCAKDEKAKRFLELICKEKGIEANETLYALIEPDKGYYTRNLRTILDEWYDDKLKTEIYPQYSMIKTIKATAVTEKAKGSAFEELQSMIGLNEAKSVIQKAVDYFKMMKLYKDHGISQDRPAMHMVFSGNPGTAKTTVARLFAEIMRDNEILSTGHVIEVGRSELVGKYVGWTANIVKEKFEKARGGVLFIDEAYSLVDDRNGSYGDEAINTTVQEMENNRDSVVVIFAGYPDKMEEFLKKNPGLRSRIAFHVPFQDYSAAELCQIIQLMAKKSGNHFSEQAIEKLENHFEDARRQPDFGNGRYARNVIEQARMNHATRLISMGNDMTVGSMLTTIDAEDLQFPEPAHCDGQIRIGFAC